MHRSICACKCFDPMVCLLIQNWTAYFHVKFIMNIQTEKLKGKHSLCDNGGEQKLILKPKRTRAAVLIRSVSAFFLSLFLNTSMLWAHNCSFIGFKCSVWTRSHGPDHYLMSFSSQSPQKTESVECGHGHKVWKNLLRCDHFCEYW